MGDISKCAWKLINPREFVLGIQADRCGEVAAVKILRPNRKTDLFLCEDHLNHFINEWGLHYELEILCTNWVAGTRPSLENYARLYRCPHVDPDCDCGGYYESP